MLISVYFDKPEHSFLLFARFFYSLPHMRPAKIKTNLRICKLGSVSILVVFRIAKNSKFLHADNKDSVLTARMRRLISVFVESTC